MANPPPQPQRPPQPHLQQILPHQEEQKDEKIPLASPLPTTAPHPRDVNLKLLQARQGQEQTCGYVNAMLSNSITCPAGEICAYNLAYANLFCCASSAFAENLCSVGVTACVDSTAVPYDCVGACLTNPANLLCTFSANPYCHITRYDFLGTLTDYHCGPSRQYYDVYNYYTNNGQQNFLQASPSGFSIQATYSDGPSSTPTLPPVTAPPGPGASNSTTPGPAPTSGNGGGGGGGGSSSDTSGGGGLSSGAKAGIAIGAVAAVAIIAGLIAFIFLQKRRNDKQRRQNQPAGLGGAAANNNNNNNNNNQPPMMQQPQSTGPSSGMQSPAMNQAHMSMASMPSATSSGVPLTQANIAAMSNSSPPPPASEVLPSESASQVNGPGGGSVLSGAGYGQTTGGSSQDHSGIGPLPQGPQYPTGPSAFPHAQGQQQQNVPGGQSVLSAGTAYGSMPPVHAPSVGPYGGGQG